MAFVRRKINVGITLGDGSVFAGTGSNSIKLTGLRVHADIEIYGGDYRGAAAVAVYGMTLSQMNQLTSFNPGLMVQRKNTLLLEAGDDTNGMSVAYTGNIVTMWADLNSEPDAILRIEANIADIAALKPVKPSSYNGTVNAEDVMQQLAGLAGYGFQNNGVHVVLQSPYFKGTAFNQMKTCANAAHIDWVIKDDKTVVIMPKPGTTSDASIMVSADTGMVGYPAYNAGGIMVRKLFDPTLSFGGRITIKSIITPANGTFKVFGLVHNIQSETPGGPWFSTIQCQTPDSAGNQ